MQWSAHLLLRQQAGGDNHVPFIDYLYSSSQNTQNFMSSALLLHVVKINHLIIKIDNI